MKIALIGNQNNNHFVITRYLRDRGYNATLILLSDQDSFYGPDKDSYDSEYQNYTIQVKWGNYHDFDRTLKESINSILKDFDFLIGVGSAPAFVNRVDRVLDLFIPCGGDLSTYPFFFKLINFQRLSSYLYRKKRGLSISKPGNLSGSKRKIFKSLRNYYKFTKHQRIGIEKAEVMLFDITNDKYEGVIKKLRQDKDRISCAPPMIYTNMYTSINFDDKLEVSTNNNYLEAKKIRKCNDLFVLQYCRQSWLNTPDWVAMKGNDKLIRGFNMYCKRNPKVKAKLGLFAFGTDVESSKILIEELHLKDKVIWFEVSSRKHVMPIVKLADIVVGELENSWLTYGIVLETLCMKKVLIHHRDDNLYKAQYEDLYPMLEASSDKEIVNCLEYYMNEKSSTDFDVQKGFDWLIKNCIENSINRIVDLIELKSEHISN